MHFSQTSMTLLWKLLGGFHTWHICRGPNPYAIALNPNAFGLDSDSMPQCMWVHLTSLQTHMENSTQLSISFCLFFTLIQLCISPLLCPLPLMLLCAVENSEVIIKHICRLLYFLSNCGPENKQLSHSLESRHRSSENSYHLLQVA